MNKNIYTNFDTLYKDLVNYVLDNGQMINEGVRTKYIDGTPAYYKQVHNLNFEFHATKNENGNYILPVITTRKMPVKSAIREIFWIYFRQSNNETFLREVYKTTFWREWTKKEFDENGEEFDSIGRGYGYQCKKPIFGYDNQTDYVIGELKTNPNSRRIITEFWNVDDLSEMTLTPCCHRTHWTIQNGKLWLKVAQRSADIAIGLSSNCLGYFILGLMIAKECGYEFGGIAWDVTNAHIYDRHIEDIKKQVELETSTPATVMLPDWKNIYDVHPDEVQIVDYKNNDLNIFYERAI